MTMDSQLSSNNHESFRAFADIALECTSESPFPVWVKDEHFRYRYVNKTFAQLFDLHLTS